MQENEIVENQGAAPDTAPQTEALTPPIEAAPVAIPVKKRKNRLGIVGAAILLLALAGAAFIGGRLLSGQPGEGIGAQGGGMMLSSAGGPGGVKSVKIDLDPAPELPKTSPTVAGLLERSEDNSLFIGTGRISVRMNKNGESSSDYDGPIVEVVVNHDTQIYRDVTEYDIKAAGEGKIKQVVKPGSIDEIKKSTMIQVWGDKQGDRVVAKTISYR